MSKVETVAAEMIELFARRCDSTFICLPMNDVLEIFDNDACVSPLHESTTKSIVRLYHLDMDFVT